MQIEVHIYLQMEVHVLKLWVKQSIYKSRYNDNIKEPKPQDTQLRILKQITDPVGPFGTMPQKPWHPGKGTKPDYVIQLNCGEMHTYASYKTTKT